MTGADASAAAAVAAVADVAAVRATSIHAQDVGRADPHAPAGAARDVDVQIEMTVKRQAAKARVLYDVHFVMSSPPRRKAPGTSIEVTYRVLVKLPAGKSFDKEELRAYGSATVVPTTYPFFREACQSLTARLGRPMTLGLLPTPIG